MLIPDSWHLPVGNGGDQLRLILFLDQRFANPFGKPGIEHKLKFIETAIYNDHLTWYNWEQHLVEHRDKINLSITQTCSTLEKQGIDKELFLTIKNKNLVVDRYFHIRLANSCSIDCDLSMIKWQDFIQTIKKSNDRKIIDSDFLHDPILSRPMYQKIINFYGFDDNYESANKVHQLHYFCHQRSLKDFCNYISSIEFSNYCDNLIATISNTPVFGVHPGIQTLPPML